MIETQVFKFRLPKPRTDVGMAFLGHQDSKVSIIKENKNGGFGKDSGVPNRKRLIIKFCIPNPKDLKNNHQDSKPINKNSGYHERVSKLLTEAFSRVSSKIDESISPSIDLVQMAALVESVMFERIGWSNPIKKTKATFGNHVYICVCVFLFVFFFFFFFFTRLWDLRLLFMHCA